MIMLVPASVLAGFLAGLLSFRVKSRWCTQCGAVKGCPRCAGWTSPVGPGSGTSACSVRRSEGDETEG
jgi:hypothetical protein